LRKKLHQFNFEIHKEKEMADFRKWIPVLVLAALMLGSAMTAGAQPITCNTNAGVPTLARSEGLTELLGDVILQCTGGNPANTFLVNWQVFLNTNVTSRNLGGGITEALLIIDDAPGGVCAVSSSNPPVLQTISGLPSNIPQNCSTPTRAQNTFYGSTSGATSLVWLGIPFTPPGSQTRTIRFTNVRGVSPNLSSTLIPSQIVEFISATAPQSIAINNPQQTVAYVQPGLQFDIRSCTGGNTGGIGFQQCVSQNFNQAGNSGQNGTSQFSVRFTEGFASAFKTRICTSGTLANPTGGTPPYCTGDQTNSTPGGTFAMSESGFVNPNLNANTGVATQGTRLMARFNNIPNGVQIFVGTRNVFGASSLDARLVATDATGGTLNLSAPGTVPEINPTATGNTCSGNSTQFGAAPLNITTSGGTNSAFAVWEVVSANPSQTESAVFNVLVDYRANTPNNLPALGTSTVLGSFAPLSTNTGSIGGPIPRFADVNISRTAFSISTCVTNLLFPFVTNQGGFDTGLAISNTSDSPFTAAAPVQSGNCKLNYYGNTTGGGAAPAAQTTTTPLNGGQHMTLTLSSGGTNGIVATPGFQGYIIAQCNFQYAHGFAFISDLGAQRLAEGYLALVMDDALGTRTGATSEVLAH
jgi:hypothetical protein